MIPRWPTEPSLLEGAIARVELTFERPDGDEPVYVADFLIRVFEKEN